MYKWIARIEREVEETQAHGFVNRPVVTVGEGFIKIASFDREILQPSDGITNVIVASDEEDGLLSVLENVDLDDLMARGLDMRNDGDELVGQVITMVVKHMRLIREVEEANAGN
jgi:hypothetical protein